MSQGLDLWGAGRVDDLEPGMPLEHETTWQCPGGISRIRQIRRVARRPVSSCCCRGAVLAILFLIPILILATIAVVPTWPYNRNWNYYPTGGLGAILVLTIVLLLLNRI